MGLVEEAVEAKEMGLEAEGKVVAKLAAPVGMGLGALATAKVTGWEEGCLPVEVGRVMTR